MEKTNHVTSRVTDHVTYHSGDDPADPDRIAASLVPDATKVKDAHRPLEARILKLKPKQIVTCQAASSDFSPRILFSTTYNVEWK